MKERLKNLMNKKAFHLFMILIIISIILFVFGIIVLKYNVEGETNMPFELTKITVISSSEGIDKQPVNGSKWAFDINQNNDIYLYIDKNKKYNKDEIIDSVIIDEIDIQKESQIGISNIYKTDSLTDTPILSNKEENKTDKIIYLGDTEPNIKQGKISNQGGIIVFRYSNEKLGEYISNDEEINHSELLKKVNITEKDLKGNIKFNITIKLQSGKQYQANISLDTPVEGILQNGMSSIENTDLKDVIFRRIKK